MSDVPYIRTSSLMVLCSRVAKAQRTKVGRQISRTTGYEIMHKKPRLGFRGSCTSVRFDLVSEFQSLTLLFLSIVSSLKVQSCKANLFISCIV